MAAENTSTGPAARPICPTLGCGEHPTKVSGIVRQQTTVGDSTTLAHYLRRPARPRASGWATDDDLFGLALGACGFGGFALVVGLSVLLPAYIRRGEPMPTWGSTILIVALAAVAVSIWLLYQRATAPSRFQSSPAGQRALAGWKSATAKWDRVYYCQKDDVCFIPGEPGSCAPPDFQRWLTE
jgi:hypothetical protein